MSFLIQITLIVAKVYLAFLVYFASKDTLLEFLLDFKYICSVSADALDLLTLQSLHPNATTIEVSLLRLLAIWSSTLFFITGITIDLQLFKVSHHG